MPAKTTVFSITLVALAVATFPLTAAPRVQRAAESRKAVRAVPTSAIIHTDGVFEEPAWSESTPVVELLQKDPEEGQPATERTEVKILYTRRSIVFGIRCYDSEASRILATELRRDNEFLNDDYVSVLLDTLHDNRSGYLFRTNALGTEYDALITDEGRVTDVNWNECGCNKR
jgi:hypothetical protein